MAWCVRAGVRVWIGGDMWIEPVALVDGHVDELTDGRTDGL